MERSVIEQALTLLVFFTGGFILGPMYDGLRLIRAERSATGAFIADALFCLTAGLLLFGLAMREKNGAFGTWECVFFALGFCAYCLSLSAGVFRGCVRIRDGIRHGVDGLEKNLILHSKMIKKYFQKNDL